MSARWMESPAGVRAQAPAAASKVPGVVGADGRAGEGARRLELSWSSRSSGEAGPDDDLEAERETQGRRDPVRPGRTKEHRATGDLPGQRSSTGGGGGSARDERPRLHPLLEKEDYGSRTLSLSATQTGECVSGLGPDCWRQSKTSHDFYMTTNKVLMHCYIDSLHRHKLCSIHTMP